MDLTERDDALYAAFKAKDTRFDGRFFVGISSTGVYCRPVCRARQTKRSSCTFFSSAAEAEQAGYRPCLLCRPELAPGNSLVDATSMLARKAARLLLAKNLLTDTDLSVLEVAMAAGFGSLRRMNDLFQKQYKLSPTALRKRASEGKGHTGSITVTLGCRPPYRWEERCMRSSR